MSRYRCELATPEDDADLRHILAQTPMEGRIAVAFRREPSFFASTCVHGGLTQVMAVRDCTENRLVGFACRSLRELHVNGQPTRIGYLSTLRLLAAHRNRGLLARAHAFLRKLHEDGQSSLYLVTIAEGNTTAVTILTSGRAGLPAYHYAGNYHTVALPLVQRNSRRPAAIDIRPAHASDLPEILEFLNEVGPRRQFFPRYEAGDFFTTQGAFKDLQPSDILLAHRGSKLVGTLARWDQHGFRQSLVEGYRGLLRWMLPLFNVWARMRGVPRLPAPGEELRYLTGALPVVAGDDPEVFAALVDACQALRDESSTCRTAFPGRPGRPGKAVLHMREPLTPLFVLIGLHESDPLLPVLQSRRGIRYITRLYLVCWPDGESKRACLDVRTPYLELGSL